MFTRRTFLATTTLAAPALFLPRAVSAKTQKQDYDPNPQVVRIRKEFEPGQLLVLPSSYYLYFVTDKRKAIRYGVGVGQAGLEFTGQAVIGVKKEWPTWRPTDEMIERSPRTYAKFKGTDYIEPGGPNNPLGARALYLFQGGRDTYIRIHGTTQPDTIGTAASNGCFRMINEHVIDLYDRVPVGTTVTVL
ncbi:L,D-transpeptidase [Rhodobacteraceae bacterium M382]|nr:L,D-transpeptidase [Rhodobacteraceae bacterium M382]